MFFKDNFFLALCFFTLGFLCLNALISLVLNFYFRNKAFIYYLCYIVLTILFVFTVIALQEKNIPLDRSYIQTTTVVYDILRVVIFYFHTLFVYKAMVLENKEIKKLAWLMYIYTLIVIFRIEIALLSPGFMDANPLYIGISRLLVTAISFIFLYYLYKEYANIYLRFLFFASITLIFFVLMSILDYQMNNHSNTLRGFMFFCTGIVLENICFIFIFIYKIITIDRERKSAEITHKEQLIDVKVEMQQQTLQHIGREIHDNVGQKLILASLYTQQLAYENKTPLITKSIENISEIINQSLSELRQLSKTLTSDTIECKSLTELLQIESERFDNLRNCKITLNVLSKSPKLGYQSKSILLRITQEFMQNSIKHSNCNTINITLSNTLKKLNLSLQDDGNGFDVSKNIDNGIGLSNIKKRIDIIGGTYTLESQSSIGTKLTLEIPL